MLTLLLEPIGGGLCPYCPPMPSPLPLCLRKLSATCASSSSSCITGVESLCSRWNPGRDAGGLAGGAMCPIPGAWGLFAKARPGNAGVLPVLSERSDVSWMSGRRSAIECARAALLTAPPFPSGCLITQERVSALPGRYRRGVVRWDTPWECLRGAPGALYDHDSPWRIALRRRKQLTIWQRERGTGIRTQMEDRKKRARPRHGHAQKLDCARLVVVARPSATGVFARASQLLQPACATHLWRSFWPPITCQTGCCCRSGGRLAHRSSCTWPSGHSGLRSLQLKVVALRTVFHDSLIRTVKEGGLLAVTTCQCDGAAPPSSPFVP